MSVTDAHLMSGLAGLSSADADEARQTPPARTSMSQSQDTPQSAVTDFSQGYPAPPSEDGQKRSHKRLALTDPVAFSYLAEDLSTTVLMRRAPLEGYEVYVVEQWACSRAHPTFIITTYTGDPSHKILVNVLGVPANEEAWSPQLRVYDRALRKYHAREKATPLGTLMVTNLSGFPSSLTVIHVPNGDLYKSKELFVVNENLKRLGCSGRAGLKLATPAGATIAKFHQLYKTSDKVPLNSSVIELVKLCQVALFLFGKLRADYVDGLLCDLTEQAVNDWWVEFGTEYYNIEPNDGILGPSTVSGLLGMLLGARNRLNAYGAPVPKDVFDIEATKRGIAYFQRSQRIEKTRRLDHRTLENLRRSTAKAASGEKWTMPRAVKSTVAELSGKGGEMVMEMVGARDKSGIADIETVDIDVFVELLNGERAKWLWHGKARKGPVQDMFKRLPGEEGAPAHKDDQGEHKWANKQKPSDEDLSLQTRGTNSLDRSLYTIQNEYEEEKDVSKRAAFRRATERMTDGRSGFGRIKDAVGRRTHQSKPSRDEHNHRIYDGAQKADCSGDFRKGSTEAATEPEFTKVLSETPKGESPTSQPVPISIKTHRDNQPELGAAISRRDAGDLDPPTAGSSTAGSIFGDIDHHDILKDADDPQGDVGLHLRRTQSAEPKKWTESGIRHEGWWPRSVSFSLAEESVLTWSSDFYPRNPTLPDSTNPKAAMSEEMWKATDARRTRAHLRFLSHDIGIWVEHKIEEVRELDEQISNDQSALEELYYPQLDEYHAIRQDTQDVITQERLRLKDAAADVEQLSDQMEYDIDQLKSKLEDVEDSVTEFERQVRDVENQVRELEEATREKEGWAHWAIRCLTGVGEAPQVDEQYVNQ